MKYALLYLLWIIIILPKELQMIVLLIFTIILLKEGKNFRLKKDTITFGLFLYIGINFFSILFNVVSGEHAIIRIFAALNTAIIWLVALLLYNIYSAVPLEKKYIINAYRFNYMILLCMTALYIICRKNNTNISFLSRNLIYIFWDDIRIMAFMEYATLVIAFIIIIFPIMTMWENRFHILFIEYLLLGITVMVSKSRTGYIVYILSGAVLIFSMCSKRMILVSIGLVVNGCILFNQKIFTAGMSLWNKLINMRAGSNQSRFSIYQESIEKFSESIIWGCGIKDVGSAGYPLGSHCTYLGILYRTGIIGFIITVFIFIEILRHILQTYKKTKNSNFLRSSILFSIIFVFLLTEDIDGANWLLAFWSIDLGILLNPQIWREGGA